MYIVWNEKEIFKFDGHVQKIYEDTYVCISNGFGQRLCECDIYLSNMEDKCKEKITLVFNDFIQALEDGRKVYYFYSDIDTQIQKIAERKVKEKEKIKEFFKSNQVIMMEGTE